jgi:hypothetical protein
MAIGVVPVDLHALSPSFGKRSKYEPHFDPERRTKSTRISFPFFFWDFLLELTYSKLTLSGKS